MRTVNLLVGHHQRSKGMIQLPDRLWTDGRMDGWTDGRMDGSIDRLIGYWKRTNLFLELSVSKIGKKSPAAST
jgi:hypothetical protein